MTQEVFTKIYNNNSWGSAESVSGGGSELGNTVNLRKNLDYLIKSLQIKTFLDVPCGDMNWMKEINLEGVEYFGWDIVKKLIEENQKKFEKNPNMSFFCKDALNDDLPTVDLIMARDMIIHFPFAATWKFLQNVVESGSQYLLISKYCSNNPNMNIEFGNFYCVDLEKSPFNFHRPLFSIKENEPNKYLVLYKVSSLRCYIKKHLQSLSS